MRGAWIEISMVTPAFSAAAGRSPCGERGLKSRLRVPSILQQLSLPVRGAWIEIMVAGQRGTMCTSLPVRGAWIEISKPPDVFGGFGRSPCGERGLKYAGDRGHQEHLRRSPCGERGLKFREKAAVERLFKSLPVRGAWIEIFCAALSCVLAAVAPRAGSVD